MKEKFLSIIGENLWWAIGTICFVIGFVLTTLVYRITMVRPFAIVGVVFAGIGFVMLMIPLTVNLIGSYLD